ncbi:hypothetical protein [Saccharopolyspora mangrovi]|uniref:Uncharacterized protein n=1 Tax=Saccharopolyspora mangrovi TaxID=3082379 RepID=A0ABU6AK51_9PSEU|nr:hypothetical protein [Saccharopolyspora sp. S2-29]MEB3371759.1 hypothetical protein [Saccharopolyspora sp. S2-29]
MFMVQALFGYLFRHRFSDGRSAFRLLLTLFRLLTEGERRGTSGFPPRRRRRWHCGDPGISASPANPSPIQPRPARALQVADAYGLELPAGFTSRVIARSTHTVPNTGYPWHSAPDGGACFADGTGWIYVSNCF